MRITTVSEFLNKQYLLRKKKNPKYSLRAFARDLKLSSGRLSEIMNGITRISKSRLHEIANNLKLNEKEKSSLYEIYEFETLKEKNAKLNEKLRLLKYKNEEYQKLNDDSYMVIANWYYFAILELTYLNDFQSNVAWIAKRLNISDADVQTAIDRLLRLQMLIINKNGEYEANEKFSENPRDVPGEIIREHHCQLINKALFAIRNHTTNERFLTSITMGFDSSKMEKAQKAIDKFAEKFNKEFSGYEENKDSVYSISIQFHRLDSNK